MPPLAAKVNGRPILLADFQQRVGQYQDALLQQGLDPDTAEGQVQLAQLRRDLLESMIDSLLIEQASEELRVQVRDEELESQVERDIAEGGGQEPFAEWLRSTGQTRDDYKQLVWQSLLAQRVMEAVTKDLPERAEQVHAYLLLVDSRETAAQVLGELDRGASFPDLARERSLDPAARQTGGDLGWLPRGVLAPEIENAAFALGPGQTSEPVPIGEGVLLVHVVEREASRVLSTETLAQLREAQFYRWLDARRASADIVRYVGQ